MLEAGVSRRRRSVAGRQRNLADRLRAMRASPLSAWSVPHPNGAAMSCLLAPLLLSPLFVCEASRLERRLWEASVRRFEADEREYPEDAVLFYGSSSIRLWRTIETDMAPRPVIQRGYGGARLSDAVGFVERVVHPHQAGAIVVFLANDIDGRYNQPTPERVGELFGELLDRVRAAHPDTPLLWVEVTPTPERFDLWPEVSQASELIRKQCEADPDAYFIPTAAAYLGDDGQPRAELFRADGLHQNAEGYAIWKAIIAAALDQIIGPADRDSGDSPLAGADDAVADDRVTVVAPTASPQS